MTTAATKAATTATAPTRAEHYNTVVGVGFNGSREGEHQLRSLGNVSDKKNFLTDGGDEGSDDDSHSNNESIITGWWEYAF